MVSRASGGECMKYEPDNRVTSQLRLLPQIPVQDRWRRQVLHAVRKDRLPLRSFFWTRVPVKIAAVLCLALGIGFMARNLVQAFSAPVEVLRTFGMVSVRKSGVGAMRALFPGKQLQLNDEVITPPFSQMDMEIPMLGQFRLKGDGRLQIVSIDEQGETHLRLRRGTLLVRTFGRMTSSPIWIHTGFNRVRVHSEAFFCQVDERGACYVYSGDKSVVVEYEAEFEDLLFLQEGEPPSVRTLYLPPNKPGVLFGVMARVLQRNAPIQDEALLSEVQRMHMPAQTAPWACRQLLSDMGQVEVALRLDDSPARSLHWLHGGAFITNGLESREVSELLDKAYRLAGQAAFRDGDRDLHLASLACFEAVLTDHPSARYNAQFHLLCASYWNYLGERDRAIEHLEQVEGATTSEDLISLSWATRGAIEEAAGNLSAADTCWRTIIERFPHTPDAALARSRVHGNEGGVVDG
jgi:hypothetical protein